MNNLGDLHILLKKRLTEPLPGMEAQLKMSARPNDSRVRFQPGSKENARHSGVLVAFYEEEGQIKLPLILRHDYGGVHSNQVSFPGGRQEPEDRDIIDTALREAEEEVGINRAEVEVLGQLSELFVPVSNHLVFPVVGVIHSIPKFVREEREVSRIVIGHLEDLLHPEKQKEKDIQVRDFSIRAPYFELDGEVVWGATAMMLSELKEVLQG